MDCDVLIYPFIWEWVLFMIFFFFLFNNNFLKALTLKSSAHCLRSHLTTSSCPLSERDRNSQLMHERGFKDPKPHVYFNTLGGINEQFFNKHIEQKARDKGTEKERGKERRRKRKG